MLARVRTPSHERRRARRGDQHRCLLRVDRWARVRPLRRGQGRCEEHDREPGRRVGPVRDPRQRAGAGTHAPRRRSRSHSRRPGTPPTRRRALPGHARRSAARAGLGGDVSRVAFRRLHHRAHPRRGRRQLAATRHADARVHADPRSARQGSLRGLIPERGALGGFVLHGVFHGSRRSKLKRALGTLEHFGTVSGHHLRRRASLRHQVRCGYRSVHQTHLGGFGTENHACRQDQLLGLRHADQVRKPVGAAQTRKDSELREGDAQLRGLGSDADITGQHHRHPDADRRSVDRGDHRLGKARQLEGKALRELVLAQPGAAVSGFAKTLQLIEIDAGAETPTGTRSGSPPARPRRRGRVGTRPPPRPPWRACRR